MLRRKRKKSREEANPENKKLIKLYGGTTAGKYGIGASMIYATSKNKKLTDDEINDIVQERRKKFDIQSDVDIEKTKNIGSKAEIGFNQRPKIHVGDNEFIVRHEMGHIEDYYKRNKKKFNKALKKGKTGEFKSYEEALVFLAKEDELKKMKKNIATQKIQQRVMANVAKTDEFDANKVFSHNIKMLEKQEESIDKALKEMAKKINPIKKAVKTRNVDLLISRGIIPTSKNIALSSLHSKAVRDKIRESNDGKSKIIDKALDVLDKPIEGTLSMALVNNTPTLIRENIASSKALKGMIESKGLKQGLKQGLPLYALQQGSYIAGGILNEASKRVAVNTIEHKVKKSKEKKKSKEIEKKAYYRDVIYNKAYVSRGI